MAVTGNTNNQTKRHGGTNAISLKGKIIMDCKDFWWSK